MFETIFGTATTTDAAISIGSLTLSLATAFLLGLVMSLVYMKTHKNRTPSQSFAITVVMLPAVIAIIILLVGSNVARAFSLAGTFSIIRFRSAPGDPKDIAYVLFSMAVGLACGMGYLMYAVVITLILGLALVLLELTKFGYAKSSRKLLKITIPENLDYQGAFDDVLRRYTTSAHLDKVRTADLGSLYELVYTVTMNDEVKEKEFIDELRCRNGNLSITMVLDAQTGEY